MGAFIYISVFIFGTIVGSFLNVVILRHNTGRGVTGRSGCFSCGKTLSWYELIPIFSFLTLRGKCGVCQSKISWQYPLVEFANGLLFVFLWAYFDVKTGDIFLLMQFIISCILWSSLLVIFVYDLKHKIIPDRFSLLFAICAVLLVLLGKFIVPGYSVFSHIIGASVLSGFFFILWYTSNGRWMGFGDVKLAFSIGLYLGLSQGLSAFAFAFWIGAGFSLVRLLAPRLAVLLGTKRLSSGGEHLTMKSEVPFAPFLIIGTFLAMILHSDIFHLTTFFNV